MTDEVRALTIDDYDGIIRVWLDAGLEYKPEGRDRRDMMAVEMDRDYCRFFGLFRDNQMIGVGIAHLPTPPSPHPSSTLSFELKSCRITAMEKAEICGIAAQLRVITTTSS